MNVAPFVIPEHWARHPLFRRLRRFIALSDSDLHSLWRLIDSEVVLKKRRDFVIDGSEYRRLCFVEEGFAARYTLLRNGKRQIVNLVLPGDIIGLPGGFVEKTRYSVLAMTELKLQVCSINAYVDLCYQRPQFALALSWLAIQEAIICGEHTINTGRRSPTERLAHFLLEVYGRLEAVELASDRRLELKFSQEVMSDALGLSVPHLNRTLATLRTEGLIAIDGRHIEFIDMKAIEQLANFQPLNLTRVPSPLALGSLDAEPNRRVPA